MHVSDSVTRQYNRILEDLNLVGIPMSSYDELDFISLIVELEKSFNISVSDDKWTELFGTSSHDNIMNHIRTLI
jgi:hypothetical protein